MNDSMMTTRPEFVGRTATELRQLAADAIREAVWIELEANTASAGPRFVGHGDNLMHINEVVPMLGVDEREARGLVESGQLRASEVDGRTYVSAHAIADYLVLVSKRNAAAPALTDVTGS